MKDIIKEAGRQYSCIHASAVKRTSGNEQSRFREFLPYLDGRGLSELSVMLSHKNWFDEALDRLQHVTVV